MLNSKACRSIVANFTITRQQMSRERIGIHLTDRRNPTHVLGTCLETPTMDCTQICQDVLTITPFNPLNPELNPICYLLALLGAHHFLHVSRIRVKLLTFRRLMSYIYIYGAPILDVSRSHTTTQHSR